MNSDSPECHKNNKHLPLPYIMTERQNIHPLICDYIASKGENGDSRNLSPNPRKLEMASDILYADAPLEMLRPLLGDDIANEFFMFCNDECNRKKTRIEKMNPGTTTISQGQKRTLGEFFGFKYEKVTTKEHVQNWIDAKIGPAIIKCPSGQDWQTLFDEPPVVIDATKMTFAELNGTDYRKRSYFEPAWFKDLLIKKVLVIENLDMLTPRDEELTDGLEYSE